MHTIRLNDKTGAKEKGGEAYSNYNPAVII